MLFPLQLALRVGGLNQANHYSMDYELWGRFLLTGAQFHYTGIPFGVFRLHQAQKTQEIRRQTDSMLDAAAELIALADSLTTETKHELLADLRAYQEEYPGKHWKTTGRLSRIGLPPAIVLPIRRVRQAVAGTISSLFGSSK